MGKTATITAILGLLAIGACSRKRPPDPPAVTPAATQRADGNGRTNDDEEARRRAAEEARTREVARLRAILEEMVHFDFDDSRIRSDAGGILQQKLPILRDHPGVQLLVTGHADERGSGEYNLALGLRRANAVRDYLASMGISTARVSTDTMGEDRPIDTRQTEEAWARNRRAETTVVNPEVLGQR